MRFNVNLATMAPHPFEIIKDIPVTLSGKDGNYTATFYEANISASGDTEADAIANFKDALAAAFEVVHLNPDIKLGPLLQRQRHVIDSVIKRKEKEVLT